MHSVMKWIVYHPWQVNCLLVVLSFFYDFPAVLLVQMAIAKLQLAIQRATKTWTRLDGFVRGLYCSIPIAILAAFLAACHMDFYLFPAQAVAPSTTATEWQTTISRLLTFAVCRWWKFVLPLPLTLRGHLTRILGLPLAVFLIGVYDGCFKWLYWLPSLATTMERANYHEIAQWRVKPTSILMINRLMRLQTSESTGPIPIRFFAMRVVSSPSLASPQGILDNGFWSIWNELQTLLDYSSCWWWRYVCVLLEIQLAFLVCGAYALSTFCNEPRHEGDELLDATRNNDLERVNALLRTRVDPNVSGCDGSTPLHLCAQQAIPSIAKALLRANADPNASDGLGFTPLHWAVQLRREEPSSSNRLEMVRLLLQHGADYAKPSGPNGTTPLALASKKANESSLEVLNEVVGDELNLEQVFQRRP